MLFSLKDQVLLKVKRVTYNFSVIILVYPYLCREIVIKTVGQGIDPIVACVGIKIESYCLCYWQSYREIVLLSLLELEHVLVELVSIIGVSSRFKPSRVELLLSFFKLFILLVTDSLGFTELLFLHQTV